MLRQKPQQPGTWVRPLSRRKASAKLSQKSLQDLAFPVANLDTATADLAERLMAVLQQVPGRSVSTSALLDTLTLEALDWAIDSNLAPQLLDTVEATPESAPVVADQH